MILESVIYNFRIESFTNHRNWRALYAVKNIIFFKDSVLQQLRIQGFIIIRESVKDLRDADVENLKERLDKIYETTDELTSRQEARRGAVPFKSLLHQKQYRKEIQSC